MTQGCRPDSLTVSSYEEKVQDLSTYSVQKVGPVCWSSGYSGCQEKQSLLPVKGGTCCKARASWQRGRKTFLSPYPFIVSHQRVWPVYPSRSGLRVCLSSCLQVRIRSMCRCNSNVPVGLDLHTTTEAMLSMFGCQFIPEKVRSGNKSHNNKWSLLLVLHEDPKFYSFSHRD